MFVFIINQVSIGDYSRSSVHLMKRDLKKQSCKPIPSENTSISEEPFVKIGSAAFGTARKFAALCSNIAEFSEARRGQPIAAGTSRLVLCCFRHRLETKITQHTCQSSMFSCEILDNL